MRRFHFFDETSGILSHSCVVIHAPDAERTALLNCPPGHKPIEGLFDSTSQRVDVEHPRHVDYEDDEGNAAQRIEFDVIDYQPPSPSADHEWNGEAKRWQLGSAAAGKQARNAAARQRIAQLEASQHRHVREHCLGIVGAAERLKAIDDEIFSLRSQLQ